MRWIKQIGKDSIIYLCLNMMAIYLAQNISSRIVISDRIEGVLVLIVTMLELRIANILVINTDLKFCSEKETVRLGKAVLEKNIKSDRQDRFELLYREIYINAYKTR